MIKENLFLNFLNILLSYGLNVNYFCNIYNRTQNPLSQKNVLINDSYHLRAIYPLLGTTLDYLHTIYITGSLSSQQIFSITISTSEMREMGFRM